MNIKLKTAIEKLFLYSAFFHMSLLVFQAINDNSLKPINYFSVLGISYFFPKLALGNINHLLSAFFAITIFYILYKIETSKQ